MGGSARAALRQHWTSSHPCCVLGLPSIWMLARCWSECRTRASVCGSGEWLSCPMTMHGGATVKSLARQ